MFHGQHDLLNKASWSRRRAAGIAAPFGRAMRQANINTARRCIALARWYRISRAMLAQAGALVSHQSRDVGAS